jgi:hypothetical protein
MMANEYILYHIYFQINMKLKFFLSFEDSRIKKLKNFIIF